MDPSHAAQFAIIAICFVLIGAVLTVGPASLEQRGAVLAGIATLLLAVAWRGRKRE